MACNSFKTQMKTQPLTSDNDFKMKRTVDGRLANDGRVEGMPCDASPGLSGRVGSDRGLVSR